MHLIKKNNLNLNCESYGVLGGVDWGLRPSSDGSRMWEWSHHNLFIEL